MLIKKPRHMAGFSFPEQFPFIPRSFPGVIGEMGGSAGDLMGKQRASGLRIGGSRCFSPRLARPFAWKVLFARNKQRVQLNYKLVLQFLILLSLRRIKAVVNPHNNTGRKLISLDCTETMLNSVILNKTTIPRSTNANKNEIYIALK